MVCSTGVLTWRCTMCLRYALRVAHQVRALLTVALNGVSSHLARRCVLSVLLSWPSELRCTSRIVGGAERLLSLAKLVVAG